MVDKDNTLINTIKRISNCLDNGMILRDDEVKQILEDYNGTDWLDHSNHMIDDHEYKRNLIYSDNNIDVFIITWGDYATTKVHDHPPSGCLLKILENRLTENIFQHNNDNGVLTLCKFNKMKVGDISYSEGCSYVHKINNNTADISVSLHIYSPPGFECTHYN